VAANEKLALPVLEAGICGQNMNLAAMAMGVGFVWTNFGAMGVERVPEMKAKLGFEYPWVMRAAVCLGYPSFKQQGAVPRHYRPVTWFRAGSVATETAERYTCGKLGPRATSTCDSPVAPPQEDPA
jgi:hypothetical protein